MLGRISSAMKRAYPIGLFAMVAALPLAAGAALRASGTAEVSFTALGPAGLHVVGTTHELVVLDDGTHVTVRVPLGRLTTGISLRDRHMRSDLDTSHYRTADLTVSRAALHFPTNGPISATARGMMRVHGQSREVSFRYTAKRTHDAIHVTGSVRVNMPRFGVAPPTYLGMTVRPDIDVKANFTVLDH